MSQDAISDWQLLRRLLALSWRYRAGCTKLILLQCVLLALGLTSLGLTGLAIDVVRASADPRSLPVRYPFGISPPSGWSPLAVIAAMAVTIVLLALLRSLLNFRLAVAVAQLVQGQIVVYLRALVYDKLQRLSFRFYQTNSSGSIINRVTGDVQSVRMFVDGVVLQLFVLVMSMAFFLTYMLSIHVTLTILCLATTPILWILSATYSRVMRPAYERNRTLIDHLILTLTENVRGAHVVKGFAMEDREITKFDEANRAARDQQHWIFWRSSLFAPTVEMLSSLNVVLLLGYGGHLVMTDKLALGTGLIVFAGLLQQLSAQVSKVSAIVNSVQQSLTGARRVFEILDTPVEIQSSPNALSLASPRGHVRFEQVTFQYQPGEPVLERINLDIQPGQCVAILGATGAGKSTLLSLIPRFYDPIQGRMLIDGIDVRQLNLDDLRRSIGMVFQESLVFSDTVAANIAFGHPNTSREAIERAAKLASAYDFIQELPEGFDTVLGEGGVNLSGGQRQRLAIARALLLEPPILLLDDPTAAVDPHTEDEILSAIDDAMEGRTTLVVAHRLSTLRRADWIVVLDEGRIVETGTHEQLMRRQGHYYQAARLQADTSTLTGPHFAMNLQATNDH